MKYYLGIDIGATNIKGGLVDANWQVIEQKTVRVTATNNTAFRKQLLAFIKLFNLKCVKAVGVGCPGPIDLKTGTIINPINLPFAKLGLRSLLKQATHKPVFIDNDANCFALAESILGAAQKKSITLGITLGTGIGGGIVMNRHIYHGRNNAGEFGHALYQYKTYEQVLHHNNLKRKIGFKKIDEAATAGKLWAKKFWEGYGQILGQGIVNLVHCFDPDIIIIGGKVAKGYRHFAPTMKQTVKKYTVFTPPPIIKSQLIDSGNILGAALLCQYHD